MTGCIYVHNESNACRDAVWDI